jgi:NAD(P)-dependent dehydrogenase (short-subunit alcohol dehydrogenase family)
MNTSFDDKVVLISGATGGLGSAVARTFAENGARLIVSARKREELQRLSEGLNLGTERILIAPADLTNPESVAALVAASQERFDRIDAVVHLTGGFAGGALVPEISLETWEGQLALNLSSAFLLARAALPPMLERGHGALVFVSSKGGSVPMPGVAAYGASKAGLEQLVRDLAEETRPRGVRVNAVAPSIIDTPANRRANPDADYSAWVQPESLADVIGFLASDAARDIHGAILPVYGRA